MGCQPYQLSVLYGDLAAPVAITYNECTLLFFRFRGANHMNEQQNKSEHPTPLGLVGAILNGTVVEYAQGFGWPGYYWPSYAQKITMFDAIAWLALTIDAQSDNQQHEFSQHKGILTGYRCKVCGASMYVNKNLKAWCSAGNHPTDAIDFANHPFIPRNDVMSQIIKAIREGAHE